MCIRDSGNAAKKSDDSRRLSRAKKLGKVTNPGPYCYQLIAATTTLVWSGPRNPRLPPYPLRLFQSSPAHSWRCGSFQRTSASTSTRPIPPTVTQTPHPATVPTQNRSVSQPVGQSVSQSASHYYYVSLCPVNGFRHRPSIRGDRWVIPARGFLKCF